MNNRVTLLRLEPATYMLALARALRQTWPGRIDLVFAGTSLTQDWDLDAAEEDAIVLPSGSGRGMAAMVRHVRRTSPGLVHTAGWAAPQSLAAIAAARLLKIPVVTDLDTWTSQAGPFKAQVKKLVLPLLLQQFAHFAPGGQRQAAYLRSFEVPDNKITPANMTVDVTAIRGFLQSEPIARHVFRGRFGIADEDKVVLFLGRLVKQKGILDLMAAWPSIRARVPQARLVIAGDGELKNLLPVADDSSISMVGRLGGADVWRAYAASDVFAAPSHQEPWGLTINEAMAASLPIVMTNVFGCIGDLAEPDHTALIVPAHSPEALAEAIISMLLSEAKRDRFALAARERISKWTIEAQAAKIADVWESALVMGR